MSYTAKIIKKNLNEEGILTVDVEINYGNKIINERFSTSASQDENWLKNSISRKIKNLEEVKLLENRIEIGDIDLSSNNIEIDTNSFNEKEIYKSDLEKFNKFVSAIHSGFTTQDNPEFIELKNKLTNNFKSEYLNLF